MWTSLCEWFIIRGFSTYEYPLHPSTPPVPQPAHSLTTYLSDLPSNILLWPPDRKNVVLLDLLIIWFYKKKSSKSPSRVAFKHPRENISDDLVHTNFPIPDHFHQNNPSTHIYKTHPHNPLKNNQPTPNLVTPPTLLPLTQTLFHIIYGLYQTNFGIQTGHIVLVIKALSHFRFQSQIQLCIQLCTGVKKRLLLWQLT